MRHIIFFNGCIGAASGPGHWGTPTYRWAVVQATDAGNLE